MSNPEKQYNSGHQIYICGIFQDIYESRILKLKQRRDKEWCKLRKPAA